MTAAKLLRKLGLWLSVFAITVLLALGLGTLIPRPLSFSGQSALETSREQQRSVLILSNPIHTDIALPADPDVLEAFRFVSDGGLELDVPGVVWIAFGWGGRSFYVETPTWADLKPGPVLNALTWDDSVMHVQRAGYIPANLDTVTEIALNQQQFTILMTEIRASFQPGPQGGPIAGASYTDHDLFFPAKGGFNALVGCNAWTARMLRQAGLKTGIWTPLPAMLTWSLHLHN